MPSCFTPGDLENYIRALTPWWDCDPPKRKFIATQPWATHDVIRERGFLRCTDIIRKVAGQRDGLEMLPKVTEVTYLRCM